jgi:hypothetical protein
VKPSLRELCLWLVMLAGISFGDGGNQETFTDRQHRGMSRWVVRRAEWLNEWLADRVLHEDEREPELIRHFYGDRDSAYHALGSYVEITPRLRWREGEDVRPGVDFSARLRVRGLSDRFRFFVDSQDDDQALSNDLFSDRYRTRVGPDQSEDATAGLIYQISDRVSRRISASGGLRLRRVPVPRLRADARFFTELSSWRAEFGQRLFWDMDDGFGERSQLQFTRTFSDAHRLQITSSAVWSEQSQGVDLAQTLFWETLLTPDHILSFRTGVQGYTRPQVESDLYFSRITYRQRAGRDWLFVELEAGLDFERENNFRETPVAGIKLICFFGSY